MERVALDTATADGGIQKTMIERGVMADQDRTRAVVGLDGLAYRTKDFRSCFSLVERDPLAQGIIEFNAGEIQCRLIDIGSLEGLDMKGISGIGN